MNTRRILPILILTTLPVSALAAGAHSSGHAQPSHDAGHGMASAIHGGDHGAIGMPGDPAKVGRTIEVVMDDDMSFTPSTISITAGETVRFFVRNNGKMPHEMVLGTKADLEHHAAQMRQNAHMSHDEPNMIALAPGQRGGLVWKFDRPGKVDFACLAPMHFESGMVGTIVVE